MDWISGIQKAVDYVEDHITTELDFSEIAKQACLPWGNISVCES